MIASGARIYSNYIHSRTPDEKKLMRNQVIAFIGPANDKEKMELSEITEDVFRQKYKVCQNVVLITDMLW